MISDFFINYCLKYHQTQIYSHLSIRFAMFTNLFIRRMPQYYALNKLKDIINLYPTSVTRISLGIPNLSAVCIWYTNIMYRKFGNYSNKGNWWWIFLRKWFANFQSEYTYMILVYHMHTAHRFGIPNKTRVTLVG